jgi:hypothetical protein
MTELGESDRAEGAGVDPIRGTLSGSAWVVLKECGCPRRCFSSGSWRDPPGRRLVRFRCPSYSYKQITMVMESSS